MGSRSSRPRSKAAAAAAADTDAAVAEKEDPLRAPTAKAAGQSLKAFQVEARHKAIQRVKRRIRESVDDHIRALLLKTAMRGNDTITAMVVIGKNHLVLSHAELEAVRTELNVEMGAEGISFSRFTIHPVSHVNNCVEQNVLDMSVTIVEPTVVIGGAADADGASSVKHVDECVQLGVATSAQ
jgi:hypothetical protein